MKKIKYVLLLISHPTYKPSDAEVINFLHEKLPEMHEGEAQVASYNISGTITPVITQNIAIDVFGEEVANDVLFTYRTISFAIDDGDGRIFVVYQRNKPKNVFSFLKSIIGRN